MAVVLFSVLCQNLYAIPLMEAVRGYPSNGASAPPAVSDIKWTTLILPWNDSTPTATDMSWLLDPPAGRHGFLTVGSDGHFYFEDGTRARFWGTNLCWGLCFPNYADAEGIACRLAKFGFNLVRLHKFDSSYDSAYNIFLNQTDNTREIDWGKVDRMDYLVYQLKIRGIYVDVNLHYERRFTAQDGVVAADQMSCGNAWVTLFNETMINLQEEFAAAVLNHTNPYTGLRYLDDPAIAMVDVVNENSMFHGFLSDDLNGLVIGGDDWHQRLDIPRYYSNELDLKWNSYLRATYQDRSQLEQNWMVGEIVLGTQNLLLNGNFESNLSNWTLQVQSGASATANWSDVDPPAPPGLALINVTDPRFTWYGGLRFKQQGINLVGNSWYTLSFWVKSSFQRKICATILKSGIGEQANREFFVAPEWEHHFWTFKATSNGGGVAFDMGYDTKNHTGSPNLYLVDNVTLFTGGVLGLQSFEDPWSNTVVRMTYPNRDSYTDNRFTDLVRFYSDIEVNFSQTMRRYLLTLGMRVPMDMTNGYYGFPSLIGQLEMDYMDTHDYWEPLYLWYGNWMKPMFTSTRAGTIPWIVLSSYCSKPVSVSEYNHFFPQPAHFECPIMIASYARLQDWDAIMLFAYGGYKSLYTDYMPLGDQLDIDRNVAVMSQMPAAANIFLRGDASPALETIILNYTVDQAYQHLKSYGMTETFQPYEFNVTQTLVHKVRRNFVDGAVPPQNWQGASYPFTSDNGEIVLAALDGYFTLKTARTQSMIGYLSNNTVVLPNLRENVDNKVAALSLTSLTQDQINNSAHLLLMAVGEVQNTGMMLDQNIPPSEMNYTTWGTAPMITQIIKGNVTIMLSDSTQPLHIFALTATGERLREVTFLTSTTGLNSVEATFQLGIDNTTWYEIFRGYVPNAHTIPSKRTTTSPNQPLTLQGYGEYNGSTDQNLIQEFRWGISSTSIPVETYSWLASTQNATFETSTEGTYTVYFKVKGPNGVWSDPVTIQIQVARTETSIALIAIIGFAVTLTVTSVYAVAYMRKRKNRMPPSRTSH
jgi:hypothetical protein